MTRTHWFRRGSLSLVLIVAGFFAGIVVTGWVRAAERLRAAETPRPAGDVTLDQRTTPAAAPAQAPVATAAVSGGGPDFTRIAGLAIKGVANISSTQVVHTRNSPYQNDPFFRYFFGDDDQFGSRDRRSTSLGSGVIISPDGYVVTNNHVVGENVREIKIALPDKREITGKVIGTDPVTDIALLKSPVTGLPATTFTPSAIGSVVSNAVSGMLGNIVHEGAVANFRSAARQAEMERRLLPFLSSSLQWLVIGLFITGSVGAPVSWRWWQRLWPAEQSSDYAQAQGLWAARAVRVLIFVLVFLPLVAPASTAAMLARAWSRGKPATELRKARLT